MAVLCGADIPQKSLLSKYDDIDSLTGDVKKDSKPLFRLGKKGLGTGRQMFYIDERSGGKADRGAVARENEPVARGARRHKQGGKCDNIAHC